MSEDRIITRFQRINLAFGCALLGATFAAYKAHAQTFDEAVRSNFALATERCLEVMIQRKLPATAFGQAGFVYRGENRGVNEFGIHRGVGHYFDAPADTAHAEVDDPNRVAGICTIYSKHLSPADASALVSALLFAQYPNTKVGGGADWSVPTASGLPLLVGVRTVTRHRYETPGTVSVSMGYPG